MSSMAARMMARYACATGGDVAEVFQLEQPTPEMLRERAKVEQNVRREEQREIPGADNFQLSGSNRAADDPTQRSLF